MARNEKKEFRCSFCGRTADEVEEPEEAPAEE